MNKTIFVIFGAIGTMALGMVGASITNWINRVDATVNKVTIIETILPTMNATVDTVKIDVSEIKGDVKVLRSDVAKMARDK